MKVLRTHLKNALETVTGVTRLENALLTLIRQGKTKRPR
jgi:hypothetical protein